MDSNALSGALLPEMMAASSPADATANVHRVSRLKCWFATGTDGGFYFSRSAILFATSLGIVVRPNGAWLVKPESSLAAAESAQAAPIARSSNATEDAHGL
jgi:hypothetical protein